MSAGVREGRRVMEGSRVRGRTGQGRKTQSSAGEEKEKEEWTREG